MLLFSDFIFLGEASSILPQGTAGFFGSLVFRARNFPTLRSTRLLLVSKSSNNSSESTSPMRHFWRLPLHPLIMVVVLLFLNGEVAALHVFVWRSIITTKRVSAEPLFIPTPISSSSFLSSCSSFAFVALYV